MSAERLSRHGAVVLAAGASSRLGRPKQLVEADGVTTMTIMLAFGDQAGREHMTRFDGFVASLDRTEDLLRSLLAEQETVAG